MEGLPLGGKRGMNSLQQSDCLERQPSLKTITSHSLNPWNACAYDA